MDFRFSPEAEAFRGEVRNFLAERMNEAGRFPDPADLTGLDEGFERRLHAEAGTRGWLDLSGEFRAVFEYEVARADAPLIDTAMTLIGRPLGLFASCEWHRRVFEDVKAGRVLACLALTEEQAGSDLRALATDAVEVKSGWCIDGRKTLVTGAHKADLCLTVAVTDPGPTDSSMSMFLVPMKTAGVEVVRRPTMNGWTLDEIVFRQATVPTECLLGQRGAGWAQLRSSLAAEGAGMFHLGFARHFFEILVGLSKSSQRDGRRLADDPLVRDRLARLAVDIELAELLFKRSLWEPGDTGELPSMVKVVCTELLQQMAAQSTVLSPDDALVLGPLFSDSAPTDPPAGRLAREYLERVHASIGAGANEFHRDVIAASVLGPEQGRD